ncbi:MAG: DNA repair and recombination protein RadB [Thermoplasmatota archaeon]
MRLAFLRPSTNGARGRDRSATRDGPPARDQTFLARAEVGQALPAMRTPIECGPLDDLLDGGVESGALTEFFGEAGAGKTNICLQLTRNVARAGRKVVFIDTEGVSLERFAQMCGGPDSDEFKRVRANVLFFEPFSLKEQESVVEKAVRLAASADVGLVVLDSATLHYRVALGARDDAGVVGRRMLAQQLSQLVELARKRDIPVVITNQVFTNIDKDDQLEPVGGQLVRHLLKAVVRLEKAGLGRRRAVVMKHRSVAEGLAAEFRLTPSGVEPVGGVSSAEKPADSA